MTRSPGSSSAVRTRPDFSKESDEDLLTLMAWKSDDPDTACAALAEFYERHRLYIYAVCHRAHAQTLKVAGVKDLVTATFKRAYERAETFKPSGLSDPARIRLVVRAWLGKIAHRLAMDIFRGRKKVPEQSLDLEHWADLPAKSGVTELSEMARLVRLGMETVLTDREREVIRVTFQYYDLSREHQRLPDEVTAELAATLRTTTDNLRKIRSTAMEKMTVFLTDHLNRSKSEGQPNAE